MKDYLRAVVHAIALLIHRRYDALEIIAAEPMRVMKIFSAGELRRQVDSIAEMLQVKPYPTVEAIMNTNEIAAREYGAAVENPLTLWDIHWLKDLDDEGFIDGLVADVCRDAACVLTFFEPLRSLRLRNSSFPLLSRAR